eukprot:286620-Pelagomonas_calceolata.AAC.10
MHSHAPTHGCTRANTSISPKHCNVSADKAARVASSDRGAHLKGVRAAFRGIILQGPGRGVARAYVIPEWQGHHPSGPWQGHSRGVVRKCVVTDGRGVIGARQISGLTDAACMA